MKITPKIAMEVASHEAVVRQAYKDSVGVWTWSVGLTNATGHNVERYIDNPQSMRKCLEVFIWALEQYADDVRETFGNIHLSEQQFAAALSFHWNTGAIRRASWVKRWKEGDNAAAKDAFMAWNKPSEIIARRKKERDLFFHGVWSNNGKMTEYTRVTSRHNPVWESAVQRDVADMIADIIDGQPAKKPAKKPAKPAPDTGAGWWADLIGALLAMFGRKSKPKDRRDK